MPKRKVGALEKVEADLNNLQEKIRRDPHSYREDFTYQYEQYRSFLTLFLQSPTSADRQGITSLQELIDFIAHVADCYPNLTKNFHIELKSLLDHHLELDADLRDKLVSSLVLLRRKDLIDSATFVVSRHSFQHISN